MDDNVRTERRNGIREEPGIEHGAIDYKWRAITIMPGPNIQIVFDSRLIVYSHVFINSKSLQWSASSWPSPRLSFRFLGFEPYRLRFIRQISTVLSKHVIPTGFLSS